MRRRAGGLAVAAGLFLSACSSNQPASKAEPPPHPFLPQPSKPVPATPPPAGPAETIAINRSLYARLGHEDGVTKIVDGTLARVGTDKWISARVAGANIPRIRRGMIDMICQASGG